jgi:hypothetical protein
LPAKNPFSERRRRQDRGTFAALSAVFLFSALVPARLLARLPSVCLLHHAGLPCPSCGLSRGFCALSHGDWQAALAYNPLTPYVYALLAGLWILYGWRALAPRPAEA